MRRYADDRALLRALLRQGVSRRNARRLAVEWDEHAADLEQENLSRGMDPASARATALETVGDASALVAAVASQPQLRSIAARRPWLTYVLAPVLSLIGAVVLALLAIMEVATIYQALSQPIPVWVADSYQLVFWFVSRALPLALAAAVAWHAARSWRPLRWPVVGVCMVLALGAGLRLQAELDLATAMGSVTVSMVGLPPFPDAWQAAARLVLWLGLVLVPYLAWHRAAFDGHEAAR